MKQIRRGGGGGLPCNVASRTLEAVLQELLVVLGTGKAVGVIIGRSSLVAIDSHEAVSLVVAYFGGVRTIDGDLKVVWSEAVKMRVVVRKQSTLKHFVWTRLNA